MRKSAYEVDREMNNDLSVTHFFKTMKSFYENEIPGKTANAGKGFRLTYIINMFTSKDTVSFTFRFSCALLWYAIPLEIYKY